jgi:hypothetical protein
MFKSVFTRVRSVPGVTAHSRIFLTHERGRKRTIQTTPCSRPATEEALSALRAPGIAAPCA